MTSEDNLKKELYFSSIKPVIKIAICLKLKTINAIHPIHHRPIFIKAGKNLLESYL